MRDERGGQGGRNTIWETIKRPSKLVCLDEGLFSPAESSLIKSFHLKIHCLLNPFHAYFRNSKIGSTYLSTAWVRMQCVLLRRRDVTVFIEV